MSANDHEGALKWAEHLKRITGGMSPSTAKDNNLGRCYLELRTQLAASDQWRIDLETRNDEQTRVIMILRNAIEECQRIPVMPFPDPGAHSWRAFGESVFRAWSTINRRLREALATETAAQAAQPNAAGRENERPTVRTHELHDSEAPDLAAPNAAQDASDDNTQSLKDAFDLLIDMKYEEAADIIRDEIERRTK